MHVSCLPCTVSYGLMYIFSYCEESIQEAVHTLIWAERYFSSDIKEFNEVSIPVCVAS